MGRITPVFVASFTDAWIETETWSRTANLDASHLLQMRGLKQRSIIHTLKGLVASFTDAWIETAYIRARKDEILVASFTDAWIETYFRSREQYLRTSHLLQMRGLKPVAHFKDILKVQVASFTDAWIET